MHFAGRKYKIDFFFFHKEVLCIMLVQKIKWKILTKWTNYAQVEMHTLLRKKSSSNIKAISSPEILDMHLRLFQILTLVWLTNNKSTCDWLDILKEGTLANITPSAIFIFIHLISSHCLPFIHWYFESSIRIFFLTF